MNPLAISLLVIGQLSGPGQEADQTFELAGCESFYVTADAIGRQIWQSWETMTRSQVKGLWPVPLAEEDDCKVTGAENTKCVLLEFVGCLSDACRCSHSLTWFLHFEEDGSSHEELKDISLNYTATKLETVVKAAEVLLSAIRTSSGTTDPQVKNWDVGSDNFFHEHLLWQTPLNEESPIANSVDIYISQLGRGWTLFVSVGRTRIPVPY